MIVFRLLTYLFTISILIFIALFVLLNNIKSTVNRVFSLFLGSIVLWISSLAFADTSKNLKVVALASSAALGAAALVFYFLLLLALTFPKRATRLPTWTPISLALPALVFIALSRSKLAIVSVSIKSYGADVVGGVVYTVFLVYALVYLVYSIFRIAQSFRHATGQAKAQLRFLVYGLSITFFIGIATNLVLVLLGNSSLGFLGPPAALILASLTAYSIVRHRLFDIRQVVARTVVYTLVLGTLGGLYSLGVFAISSVLFGNGALKTGQAIINMVLALMLVFTFQPLRRFFEKVTDKIFYRDKYDSQQLLNQITQVLAQEIDLQKVLDRTLTMIAQAVRVNFGQYLIFDEGKVYKVEHYGRMPEKLITTPELKALNRPMVVADELEAGRRKEVMDEHGIRLSLALRTKDEFVGFLLLGDKLSGDIYSTQDIELFEILANELAVAIVNAKAYEEIAQFNITLQDKVNQATSRLRVANRHLKDLDRAKDEFISMASHQLRTPLTTIKGYISMLQEGDAGKITKDQKEFLNYAYDGSERMVGLISDLLNVSRMNSGKFMIDRAPVDPVKMVADEVRQLQSHAEAKQLKLIWVPPKAKLPEVSLDENKTRQVIMNFIDNAIYYTKEGSVTVALDIVDGQLELRVTDTGIGVPAAARDKLFSKFFRAGNAQQVRPDGTGLGLYLAKRVVGDQGGTIIFESTEGKGSTFGFRLPIKASAAAKTAPSAASLKTAPNPKIKPVTKVAVHV